MRLLIQFEREREDQVVELRGQNEDPHATLAKMQLKNRWEIESSLVLQRGHKEFDEGI